MDTRASFVCVCVLQRLLTYIQPDKVHVMEAGKIIYSGGMEVADILEADGYKGVRTMIAEQSKLNGKVAAA